ncbi:MAG: hypothetical protein WCK58_07790 [Chloroflexota bacterium]
MSKRHTNNRRKSYGRRLHELHERRQDDHAPDELDPGLDARGVGALADRLAFLDPRTPRLQFALGD